MPPRHGPQSVSLDYRPDGTQPNRRPSLRWLKEREGELAEALGPRGAAFDALTEGMRQVHETLDTFGTDPPKGVIVVAQPAAGEFRAIPLAVPVANSLTVAPRPMLAPLARLQAHTHHSHSSSPTRSTHSCISSPSARGSARSRWRART